MLLGLRAGGHFLIPAYGSIIPDMSDLKWEPVRVRLGQIRPWTENPRLSTKAEAQRLIKSERELGQPQTLAIGPFDSDGICDLYDGHQRHAAWFTVKGAEYEINALQSNRALTDDERHKIAILLHTATGRWDWEKLSSWDASSLKDYGFDQDQLSAWNNDANNLREMMQSDETIDRDSEWSGMPEFNNPNISGSHIVVHFEKDEDKIEFGRLISQELTEKTRGIWYPQKTAIDGKQYES